ncbi:MAG: sugar ABC transporter permease [Lachnospiraceae bacterium]|nr:sugar ABC transporter permease [Lachnospiraceae bacterium]
MKKALEIFKKHTMLIVLVLVVLFFTITTGGSMVSSANFNSLITQNAYVYVLATGMMMCMLTGGNIDLSVGSVVCFLGAIGGTLMVNKGWSTGSAMAIMLVVGLLSGCLQGFLIAYLNIPPWISTLAGYLAFRGWGTAILDGLTISPMPDDFVKIFSGNVPDIFGVPGFNLTCLIVGIICCVVFALLQLKARATKESKGYEVEAKKSTLIRIILVCAVIMIFTIQFAVRNGIPYALIWIAVVVLIYEFITSKTTIGRYFYTIGGNVEATRLSGIDTKKIFFLAYLNMAFLTVIATWLTLARLTAANPTAGTNYEMDAISACVVGGVSAYGGSGSVLGMVVGATLIGVINLGMSLMGIDANWQKVVKGVVLLAAVVFEIMNNKPKTKA